MSTQPDPDVLRIANCSGFYGDRLAAALGACPACWGEDPSCRWCRGRGAPGALAPDPEEFTTWVVPAVRAHVRLRDHRVPKVDGGPVVVDQEENA